MTWLSETIMDVRAEIPDCPSPAAERAVLKAAAQFFRETGAWVQKVPFTMAAGRQFKDLSMRVGGRLLYVKEAVSDPPGLNFEIDGQVFRLAEAPDAEVSVELVVVCGDPDKKAEIPEDVWAESSQGVLDGALMRLFRMPQPWGNAALSVGYERDFRREIGRVRGRIMAAGQSVKFEAFGRDMG